MTDRKTTTTTVRNRRPRGGRGGRRRIPMMGLPGAQTCLITCRVPYGTVSSGTSGILSVADVSPTIQGFTEYSTLSSLYGEIKLMACTIVVSNACSSASINGRVMMGTQMQASAASHASTPLVASQVENLARVKYFNVGYSIFDRAINYRMVVPRQLDWADISRDSPNPPTPFAGCPGVVYLYGDNLSASFQYIKIDIIATFMLRGRV